MLKNENSTPKLQPPGQGLPKVEHFIARILVGLKMRNSSVEEACRVFNEERKEILSIVHRFDPSVAAKRILIKRLKGLEDSSRYWSLYMTIDHISIVNRSILDSVVSLNKGSKPQIVVSTAAVKPREDVDQSIVSFFESICDEFVATFPPSTHFDLRETLVHPWFGELNARQWHFFAGFHMSLHKKQLMAIANEL